MVIDGIGAIFFVLLFLYGMRRGFFKEVIGVAALAGAFYCAVKLHPTASRAAELLVGLPPWLGTFAGGVGVFLAAYFVLLLLGRLGLKFIRKTPGEMVEDAAEEAADEAYYDTDQGPITMLTEPLPQRGAVYYWLDKTLGGILGLFKASIACVALFLIVATLATPDGPALRIMGRSVLFRTYRDTVDPTLRLIPEYQLLASIRDVRGLVETVRERPGRIEEAVAHPEVRELGELEAVRELTEDEEIRAAWEERRFKDLVFDSRVWGLLRDPEVRRALAEVDYDEITADVEGAGEEGRSPAEDAETPVEEDGTDASPLEIPSDEEDASSEDDREDPDGPEASDDGSDADESSEDEDPKPPPPTREDD